MTDKELQRLRREDLLQILIGQQKQIQDLTEALDSAEHALADRKIKLEQAGSIAEASLQLNGVFEAAQRAADDYLTQAKEQADALLAQAKEKLDAAEKRAHEAEQTLARAKAEAERIVAEAARSASPEPVKAAEQEEETRVERPRRRLFGRG